MTQSTSDKDRILARQKGGKTASSTKGEKEGFSVGHLLREVRGWTDALMFAFLLAMFIRVFLFELFMIPTGSMTPTLIGDQARLVNEYDWTGDGQEDIVGLVHPQRLLLQVHLRNGGGDFEDLLLAEGIDTSIFHQLANPNNKGKGRRDMIMVNKFSYWFSLPERGDIVVFKTPDRFDIGPEFAFQPDKPVYIKRVVGLPGETLVIQPIEGYEYRGVEDEDRITPAHYRGVEAQIISQPILVDGEPLTDGVFSRLHHFPPPNLRPMPEDEPLIVRLSDNGLYLLGDNQMSSSDSRYWGEVPATHIRGRAILRYYPLRAFGRVN